MKLLTFRRAEGLPGARLGVVLPDGDQVLDLALAAQLMESRGPPWLADMIAFLAAGPQARQHALALIELAVEEQPEAALARLSEIRMLAPVPRPKSLRDCMAFERHVVQSTRTAVKWRFWPLAAADWASRVVLGRGLLRAPRVFRERPLYYKGNPATVVGHGADVRWPAYTEKLDFELELGVFIGRGGRDIPRERAAEHIGGFTIYNDFSARDVQLREMQGRLGPAKGKDFDTGNAMGPYLVTPDEVPDPYDLTMTARVDGETWTTAHSGEMSQTFEEMIAYISRDETLEPGDFIGSGTAPGGCGLELDRWIKPGAVIELEIERLGVLRNRVVREAAAAGQDEDRTPGT